MTDILKTLIVLAVIAPLALAETREVRPKRRILYNSDGCSILIYRNGMYRPTTFGTEHLNTIVDEITPKGSQVDTYLLCVNAQTMFYPSEKGTMIGSRIHGAKRANWPPANRMWIENLERFYAAGVDPYGVILRRARERGLERLITFRMNDAHAGGEDSFLRCALWVEHPEYRLGYGLDFGRREVRDYTLALIREVVERYDCEGVELDFNRFPTYFKNDQPDKSAKLNEVVKRARAILDDVGRKRGKRLVLAARVPSNMAKCDEIGCDAATWAARGWIDFLTVSEMMLVRYDLPIRPWKDRIRNIPIYGSIESTAGEEIEKYLTAADYRRAARHLWRDGADGIYLFNFIMSREVGPTSREPPFEVLTQLGDPQYLGR